MTTVREVMTPEPVVLESSATVQDAAQRMRDDYIGNVLVADGPTLRGIVTDRDLATRVLADGRDPAGVTLGDVVSTDLEAVAADDDAGQAVEVMRREAVKRVPVVEDGVPVGILSMGDLALSVDDMDVMLSALRSARPDEQG